jgi:hypothetical protein
MLDIRIMIGAFIVCISIFVVGARLLATNETLLTTDGERPDFRVSASERPDLKISIEPRIPLTPGQSVAKTVSTRPPSGTPVKPIAATPAPAAAKPASAPATTAAIRPTEPASSIAAKKTLEPAATKSVDPAAIAKEVTAEPAASVQAMKPANLTPPVLPRLVDLTPPVAGAPAEPFASVAEPRPVPRKRSVVSRSGEAPRRAEPADKDDDSTDAPPRSAAIPRPADPGPAIVRRDPRPTISSARAASPPATVRSETGETTYPEFTGSISPDLIPRPPATEEPSLRRSARGPEPEPDGMNKLMQFFYKNSIDPQ